MLTNKFIFGLTYRQFLRLLRQCYRHGFYCIRESVTSITNRRYIYLQKCNYTVCLYIPDSYTDIWGIKHTWENYLKSKGCK